MTQKHVDIDRIMHAVSATECLGSSPRQYNLLKYLLTEQNEGRGKRVKAYSIAIDVLGRDEGFDNSIDSIVRVEMHRLRKNLALFNQLSDEFSLNIPKATYQVDVISMLSVEGSERKILDDAFARRDGRRIAPIMALLLLGGLGVLMYTFKNKASSPSVALQECSIAAPNLVVMPTRMVGVSDLPQGVALTIDNYLRTGIAQYSMVNMVSGLELCDNQISPLYRMTAEVFKASDHNYISVIVESVEARQVVFTDKLPFVVIEGGLPEHVEWSVYRMTSRLLHASGVVPRDAITRNWGDVSREQDYLCQVFAYKYTAVHLPGYNYRESVECMERAIEGGSQNANLYGMLAAFYLDQGRGYQPSYIEKPYEKAVDLLDRAEAIDPYNTNVLLARLRWIRLNREYSKERLKHLVLTIENQQPYNPNVLRITALFSGFVIGDWEHAAKISERALKLDPTGSNQYYYIRTAYALLHSSPETVYEISLKLYEPNSKVALVLCLASANKATKFENVALYKQHLATLGLKNTSDYIAYINSRDYEPKIHTELMKWIDVEN